MAGCVAGGVTAVLRLARMRMRAVVVDESAWWGGMLTGGGVSALDGNIKGRFHKLALTGSEAIFEFNLFVSEGVQRVIRL